MKADRDDAPQHLKRSASSQGTGKWLVAISLGVGITALAAYFAGDRLSLLQHKPVVKSSPTESYTPAYEFNEPADRDTKTPEQQFWDNVNERDQAQPKLKQTDYNANNYTPKGAVNVVSMEGVRNSEAYRNPTRSTSTPRQNDIEHTGEWVDKWSGGARYYAEWTVINNYIDDPSVCENHKYGSIENRECRKGAKQFFTKQCREWETRADNDRKPWSDRMKQRYCSAASSFSPL